MPFRVERWRRFALYVLLFGMAGTTLELILLGHTEDRLQWVPLVLLVSGSAVAALVAVRPSRPWVVIFGAVMVLYLPAGATGVYLHLRSNVEFELEMRPTMEGWELARESLRGAMPALAPGTMIYLGLLGLLTGVGHPSLGGRRPDRDPSLRQE